MKDCCKKWDNGAAPNDPSYNGSAWVVAFCPECGTQLGQVKPKETADERGQKYFGMKNKDIPDKAHEYMEYVTKKIGCCGEALLDALTAYAHFEEGLPTDKTWPGWYGDYFKKNPVFCCYCEEYRDDETNWKSRKHPEGGESWEFVGACFSDKNRLANWLASDGARNRLPCDINANNDCPWYKAKY